MLNDFELVIYGLVGVGIFAWSSADLRSFAQAFFKAREGYNQITKESSKLNERIVSEQKANDGLNKDLILLKTAEDLGIETRGKTRQQIAQEIDVKVKELSGTAHQI